MRTAIYPGSFDPITNGHVDIIRRALEVVDKVVVAVGVNPKKQPFLSATDRMQLIYSVIQNEGWGDRVRVITFSGLLVNFMQEQGIKLVIRGLRAVSDFEQEFSMALMNRSLYPKMESIFLMTGEKYLYTSSSAIRELFANGGDFQRFVPEPVALYLARKVTNDSLLVSPPSGEGQGEEVLIMRLFIPEIGTQLVLTSDWTFQLYVERRNERMALALGIKEPFVKYGWTYPTTMEYAKAVLPVGTVLKVDRIYIRKTSWGRDASAYSSVSFWATIPGVKKRARFWAKLVDVNCIECDLY